MESSNSFDILVTLTARSNGATTTTTVRTTGSGLPDNLLKLQEVLATNPDEVTCTFKARRVAPSASASAPAPAPASASTTEAAPSVLTPTPVPAPAVNPWKKPPTHKPVAPAATPAPVPAPAAAVDPTKVVGRKPRTHVERNERSRAHVDRPRRDAATAPVERDPAFYAALDKFRAQALSEVVVDKGYVDEQLANEPYMIRNGAPSESWCVALNALRRHKVEGGKRVPREERVQLDDEEKVDGHEFSRSKTYSSERFQRALWEAYHAMYPSRVVDVFTTRGGKTMLKIQV